MFDFAYEDGVKQIELELRQEGLAFYIYEGSEPAKAEVCQPKHENEYVLDQCAGIPVTVNVTKITP
jgi:hypothetical protein